MSTDSIQQTFAVCGIPLTPSGWILRGKYKKLYNKLSLAVGARKRNCFGASPDSVIEPVFSFAELERCVMQAVAAERAELLNWEKVK